MPVTWVMAREKASTPSESFILAKKVPPPISEPESKKCNTFDVDSLAFTS